MTGTAAVVHPPATTRARVDGTAWRVWSFPDPALGAGFLSNPFAHASWVNGVYEAVCWARRCVTTSGTMARSPLRGVAAASTPAAISASC